MMITRKEALQVLLKCLFGTVNISLSPAMDNDVQRTINSTGQWFRRKKFDRTDWSKYCQLFEVIFGRNDFILYDTNGAESSYTMEKAIENIIQYFIEYDMDVSCLSKQELFPDYTLFGTKNATERRITETWDKAEIIKRAFCDYDGILFCILVSDEGKRKSNMKPEDEDIQDALYSVLQAKKAFIEREMSDYFQGEIPKRMEVIGKYDSKEKIACEFNYTVEQVLELHNKKLFLFSFPIQINVITLKNGMTTDEIGECYCAVAWEEFKSKYVRPPKNMDDISQIMEDDVNAALRRKVLDRKTSGILTFEIGHKKPIPFSQYNFVKCSIEIDEKMVIEHITCGGSSTLDEKVEKAYESEYKKWNEYYQKYCESALDYWDEILKIIADIDYKMLITRTLCDIEKSQTELKKIVSDYKTLFHALSIYEKSKEKYREQMYFIIQYFLLRVTWILQRYGEKMALVFRENTNKEKFDSHKRRIDKLYKKMKENGISAMEEDFEKQNKKLYKTPSKIEDVYSYRSPDMIKNLMCAIEKYKEHLRKNSK